MSVHNLSVSYDVTYPVRVASLTSKQTKTMKYSVRPRIGVRSIKTDYVRLLFICKIGSEAQFKY